MNQALPRDYPVTDDLDREIAIQLAADARTSYRKIAADLGITEGTVRARMKRLQGSGLLQLVPIINLSAAGSSDRPMLFVTIRCAAGKMEAVRDALLAVPTVKALYDANAAHRLVAICMLDGLTQATQLTDTVLELDGVLEAETEVVFETIKYDAAIAPIATIETTPQG